MTIRSELWFELLSIKLFLFNLYASLISRLTLFRQTAFPNFLLTATPKSEPAFFEFVKIKKFALIFLSDESKISPWV